MLILLFFYAWYSHIYVNDTIFFQGMQIFRYKNSFPIQIEICEVGLVFDIELDK